MSDGFVDGRDKLDRQTQNALASTSFCTLPAVSRLTRLAWSKNLAALAIRYDGWASPAGVHANMVSETLVFPETASQHYFVITKKRSANRRCKKLTVKSAFLDEVSPSYCANNFELSGKSGGWPYDRVARSGT